MLRSHTFSALWRPQLHVVCAIAYGVGEMYFTSDADLKKDSNCQRTILARVLDIVQATLKERNLEMPAHAMFHVTPSAGSKQGL